MFNKKRLFQFVWISFLFAAMFLTSTYAQEESKSVDVKKGDVITTKLELKINKDEKSHAYKGKLDYDKNIFEPVNVSDFQLMNHWEQFIYNEQTQEFVLVNKKGSQDKDIIFSVNLKVKENSSVNDTVVSFRNLESSEGNKIVQPKQENIQIHIQENIQKPQTNLEVNQNVLQNNVGANTGITDYKNIYLFFMIISFVVIVVVVKKKWGRSRNFTSLWILVILSSLLFSSVLQANASNKRGDINEDGVVNNTDIRILSKFLVKKGELTEKQKEISNLDHNKNIDVVDLAILVTLSENENTTKPEQPSPQPEEKPETPKPEQPTPKPEEKPETPKPEQPTPKPEAPKPEQPTPQPEEKPETPKPEQPTPQPEEKPEAPKPEQPTPQPEEKPEKENITIAWDKSSYELNKGEETKVTFTLKGTEKEAKEITINNRVYNLTNNGNHSYSFTYTGEQVANTYKLKVEQIVIGDNEVVSLTDELIVKIVKEKPVVSEFRYDKKQGNEVVLYVNIEDVDNALSKISLIVKDKESNVVFQKDNLEKGVHEIPLKDVLKNNHSYVAIIQGSYDLDSQENVNDVKDEVLKELIINLTKNNVQLKDIDSVALYKKNSEQKIEEVTSLNVGEKDFSPYFVKVNMKSMPAIYSSIKESKQENGNLLFVLDNPDLVTYDKNGEELNNAVVTYGKISDSVAHSNTIQSFLDTIRKNPDANITLDRDLDFGTYVSDDKAVIMQEFTGELDGNGYTIKNLNLPLFDMLKNAKIKNLNLEDIYIGAGKAKERWGAIANTSEGTTIENVHANNVKIQYTEDNYRGTGGFVGIFKTGTIANSSITNLNMEIDQGGGGFAGQLNSSTVSNSYVQGYIGSKHPGVGGIASTIAVTSNQRSRIENCYVDIVLNVRYYLPDGAGGIVGNGNTNMLDVVNTISFAQRGDSQYNGHRFHGSGPSGNSKNNFEMKESGLRSNKGGSVTEIEKNEIYNNNFFQTRLTWSPDIWDFSPLAKKELPILKSNVQKQTSTMLPEVDTLKLQEGYVEANQIAYYNAYRLMPYYGVNKIVENGNILASKQGWNTKKIKTIYAYDTNNQMVRHLDVKDKGKLAKIRVYFDDYSMNEYSISADMEQVYQVANYKIADLNVDYNFHSFYMNKELPIYKEIIDSAKSYVFNNGNENNNLGTLTSEKDDRLIIENYEGNIKPNLEKIVYDILASNSSYLTSDNNEILAQIIKQELLDEKWLMKYLFVYNYLDRWYNLNYKGISGRDLVFYDVKLFDENSSWSTKAITNAIMLANTRSSRDVVSVYDNIISKYTKQKNVPSFIEFLSKNLAGYSDTNQYFKDTFKGLVYEGKPAEQYLSYGYTAWDIISRRPNFILPMLTMPTEDMYIVSTVGHLYVGSMNMYNDYKQKQGEEDLTQARQRMMKKMESFGTKFASYYTHMLNVVEKPEIMKTYAGTQFDSRAFNYKDERAWLDIDTTQEPVLKNFYYAIGRYINQINAGAYAEGYDVAWISPCLDDFTTATHESIHNEESNFIFGGYGRRDGSHAEWYTDSVMAQGFGADKTVFNFSESFKMEDEVATNLTPERVDSREKIKSYYGNMWEALYLLDYIEGQALLQLTPKQKSLIVEQVNWKDTEPTEKSKDDVGCSNEDFRRTKLTEEQLATMEMSTIEDLYDYRIIMNINNNRNYQSIYHTYWYIPHYNNRVGDAWAYYTMSKELLGYSGWLEGFVGYASGKYPNDLTAIKQITGFDSFKEYKMSRFKEVETKKNQLSYLNVDGMIKEFVKQFKMDTDQNSTSNARSKSLRRAIYHNLKRMTNDFRTSIYAPEKVVVTNANELKAAIEKNPAAYIELGANIDMSTIQSDSDVYFEQKFMGVIDGKDNKLTNVSKTLFKETRFASIKDIYFETPTYSATTKDVIAKHMDSSILYGIIVMHPTPKVTFATNQKDSFTLGDCFIVHKPQRP